MGKHKNGNCAFMPGYLHLHQDERYTRTGLTLCLCHFQLQSVLKSWLQCEGLLMLEVPLIIKCQWEGHRSWKRAERELHLCLWVPLYSRFAASMVSPNNVCISGVPLCYPMSTGYMIHLKIYSYIPTTFSGCDKFRSTLVPLVSSILHVYTPSSSESTLHSWWVKGVLEHVVWEATTTPL